MKYPEFERITITLIKEQVEWIDGKCEQHHINRSELIRRAIQEFIRLYEFLNAKELSLEDYSVNNRPHPGLDFNYREDV